MQIERDREVLRNGQESERGLEAGFEKENSENENDGKYFTPSKVIRRN